MCKMKQKFVFFSVLSALFVLPLTAESAQSPRLVCDFPGVKDNPRNGEGDFVRLNDGSVFYAYGKFVGKNNWRYRSHSSCIQSCITLSYSLIIFSLRQYQITFI